MPENLVCVPEKELHNLKNQLEYYKTKQTMWFPWWISGVAFGVVLSVVLGWTK